MTSGSLAIVVLGMHRSGTSVLTQALGLLGADLGDRFLAGNEWNERGHFELAEVVRINDELLQGAGRLWDSIEVSYADVAVKAEPFVDQAASCLAEVFADAPLWGLKDPRMCRLLPFWHRVFARLGASDAYVLGLRNPLSVAQSLERRDGFAVEKGCLLWGRHMRAAIEGTRGRRGVVVDYDRFLDAPAAEVRRIAAQLGLLVPPAVAAALPEHCSRLVDASLRHGRFDERALYEDARVPDTAKELYRELRLAAQDQLAFPALATRPLASRSIEDDFPWLARAVPCIERELAHARGGLASLSSQIADARRAHVARDEIEFALREQAGAQRGEIDAARDTIDGLRREVDAARETIDGLRREIDAARSAHAARDAMEEALRIERDTAASRAAQLDVELHAARHEAASRAGECAALTEQVSHLHAALASLTVELDRRAATERLVTLDRDRLAAAERDARDHIGSLAADLEQAGDRARMLAERLAAADGELGRLEARWLGRLARRLART